MRLIKTATLTGTYDWFYPLDEAFDQTIEGFEEELEAAVESNDAARMERLCHPNQKPVRWKLRHLVGEARRYVLDYARDTAIGESVSGRALRKACAHGLAGVHGLTSEDGQPYLLKQDVKDSDSGCLVVSPKVMDELETIGNGSLVSQIGMAVIGGLIARPNS